MSPRPLVDDRRREAHQREAGLRRTTRDVHRCDGVISPRPVPDHGRVDGAQQGTDSSAAPAQLEHTSTTPARRPSWTFAPPVTHARRDTFHGAFNVPDLGLPRSQLAQGFILDPEERISIHAADDAEANRPRRRAGCAPSGSASLPLRHRGPHDGDARARGASTSSSSSSSKAPGCSPRRPGKRPRRDEAYLPGSLHIPFRLLRGLRDGRR